MHRLHPLRRCTGNHRCHKERKCLSAELKEPHVREPCAAMPALMINRHSPDDSTRFLGTIAPSGAEEPTNVGNRTAKSLHSLAQNHHRPCKSMPPLPATSAPKIRDVGTCKSVTYAIQYRNQLFLEPRSLTSALRRERRSRDLRWTSVDDQKGNFPTIFVICKLAVELRGSWQCAGERLIGQSASA